MTTRRALATWLALAVLFWQALLSAGAIERPMVSPPWSEAGLVICTEHGMQALPAGSDTPVHNPADHSAPSCPCCLSFAASNAAIPVDTVQLASPAWVTAVVSPPIASAPFPGQAADTPQQPRAPPLSI